MQAPIVSRVAHNPINYLIAPRATPPIVCHMAEAVQGERGTR
jgi:hypothetical protein